MEWNGNCGGPVDIGIAFSPLTTHHAVSSSHVSMTNYEVLYICTIRTHIYGHIYMDGLDGLEFVTFVGPPGSRETQFDFMRQNDKQPLHLLKNT
jgi:hypothetical protein